MSIQEAYENAKKETKDATGLGQKIKAYIVFAGLAVLAAFAFIFITRNRGETYNEPDPELKKLEEESKKLEQDADEARAETERKRQSADQALNNGEKEIEEIDRNSSQDITKKIDDWNNDSTA